MAPSSPTVERARPRWGGLARVAAALVVAFLAIQVIHPTLPNPPVVADLAAPPDVARILRTSCYDCHSNETRLRWFDEVEPAYWMVVKDVENGRARLNFSDLGKLGPGPQKAVLYEAVNQIQLGAMPPRSYTLVHPGAAVTPDDLAQLKRYLHPQEGRSPVSAGPSAVAPVLVPAALDRIRPVVTGLAFMDGYENWRPMTTTDRFDNGTLRVILANGTAAKAIDEDRVAPWPDGSAFAKVAWNAAADAAGIIRPTSFKQVEFMVKDSAKAGATEGWNWGRWLGADLEPYGATPGFVAECTGCHAPMRANDFVFTLPIHQAKAHAEQFNGDAVLPPDLPYQPLKWRFISSSVDEHGGAMSTVYGNDLAVDHSRSGSEDAYPPGSIVARVTWAQREDPHWFGARIPGQVKSVELVTAGVSANPRERGTYQAFEGDPLRAVVAPGGAVLGVRVDALLDERASRVPDVAHAGPR
jgi:hypothetical protein